MNNKRLILLVLTGLCVLCSALALSLIERNVFDQFMINKIWAIPTIMIIAAYCSYYQVLGMSVIFKKKEEYPSFLQGKSNVPKVKSTVTASSANVYDHTSYEQQTVKKKVATKKVVNNKEVKKPTVKTVAKKK